LGGGGGGDKEIGRYLPKATRRHLSNHPTYHPLSPYNKIKSFYQINPTLKYF